jgi:dUTP pyrophosphatase
MQTTGREEVSVRVKRLPHAEGLELPAAASAAAAGLDVRAAVENPIVIEPGAIRSIPTGLCVEIPEGFEIQIRPRSGLATRHGITLANSPATIDADYRGEISIGLIHLGHEPFTIERGMRIAQLVLARVPRLVWEESADLTTTVRGAGGFGHTGTA